uniref:Uncharacterized protein n=1 Tax=Moniliophthora roreri TaxID=221103 RepID=A0A0W0GDN5_MONRR
MLAHRPRNHKDEALDRCALLSRDRMVIPRHITFNELNITGESSSRKQRRAANFLQLCDSLSHKAFPSPWFSFSNSRGGRPRAAGMRCGQALGMGVFKMGRTWKNLSFCFPNLKHLKVIDGIYWHEVSSSAKKVFYEGFTTVTGLRVGYPRLKNEYDEFLNLISSFPFLHLLYTCGASTFKSNTATLDAFDSLSELDVFRVLIPARHRLKALQFSANVLLI